MKKLLSILLIVGLLIITNTSYARAQSASELDLGMSRDFGYAGFGNDIQGLFSLKVRNPPSDLSKVKFFIDDTEMGEDIQSPFGFQFNTDTYALGVHSLHAVGYTASGKEYNSNQIQVNFVAASQGTKSAVKIIVPIFGLILLIGLASVFLPLILNKGKVTSTPFGTPRKYSVGGGAICPKCGRPFPLRLWWINLGLHKIDRCPYCGKWSFVRPRSIEELRKAEAAELTLSRPEPLISAESDVEKLNKELDDSKYQNN